MDLSADATAADLMAVLESPILGDYSSGLKALQNPKPGLSTPVRTALQTGIRALISHDSADKVRAVQLLNALPIEMKDRTIVAMLGALGANREALQVVADLQARRWFSAAGWLYLPSMRGALSDPAFPAFAQRLGLMNYWKTTHAKPDVCLAKDPPPFCRMI